MKRDTRLDLPARTSPVSTRRSAATIHWIMRVIVPHMCLLQMCPEPDRLRPLRALQNI